MNICGKYIILLKKKISENEQRTFPYFFQQF